MSDSKECKIIDTINVIDPEEIIQTPCGKFLIGVEYNSIYCYNLETRQKFRIAGRVYQVGHKDGTRDESRFKYPKGLTLSKDLKTLFVVDSWEVVIRAICVKTGITTTFAGQVGKGESVDGPKEKACFTYPYSLKLSPDGNTLFVVDVKHLRTICIATGQVDTIIRFVYDISDFAFHPDGKHIYICCWNQILKYNLETDKIDFILERKGYNECDLSKDGQLLFISGINKFNKCNKRIEVINLDTNELIDTITTSFEPGKVCISQNSNKMYACDYSNNKIQVLDISKYCTNFKTFLQLQLSKHSFLSRSLVKRIN